MRDFLHRRYPQRQGPLHIWFGVSVEDGSKKSRIQHLQEAPAGERVAAGDPTKSEALGHQEFILGYQSFEPLGPSCLPV